MSYYTEERERLRLIQQRRGDEINVKALERIKARDLKRSMKRNRGKK